MTLLLDTHALFWLAVHPERLSRAAAEAVEVADELAVAATTWYELARMVRLGRVATTLPVRTFIEGLAREVRTVSMTPSIAVTAAELPRSFLGDPSDRQIFATAKESGWRLITVDRDMHAHDPERTTVLW